MSFSSARWTIPELCVWIATRSKNSVNSLGDSARRSLKYADLVCPGARQAADDVLAAAQAGKIEVSCAGFPDRHRSNPDRLTLTRAFWRNAEICDAGHWMAPGSFWCVARQVGQTNPKDHRDLLVDSKRALGEWKGWEEFPDAPPPSPALAAPGVALLPVPSIEEPAASQLNHRQAEGMTDHAPQPKQPESPRPILSDGQQDKPKPERAPDLVTRMADWWLGDADNATKDPLAVAVNWRTVAVRWRAATRADREPSASTIKRLRGELRLRQRPGKADAKNTGLKGSATPSEPARP